MTWCAQTREVLRVLLPQELRGDAGVSLPYSGVLFSSACEFSRFSVALPPMWAWPRGNVGCMEGPFWAGWRLHSIPPQEVHAESLSLKELDAILGPTYAGHMHGGGRVDAGLGLGMLYPSLLASLGSLKMLSGHVPREVLRMRAVPG